MILDVNKELCISCGQCVRVCPMGIIALDNATIPFAQPHMESGCILCGHCAAICPADALNLYKMPLSDMPKCQDDHLDIEQILTLVRNRRSIRRYENRTCSQKTIAALIKLASYAPSAHNDQEVGWIVVSGLNEVKKIAALVVDWLRALDSSQPSIFQAINGQHLLDCWKRGQDPILRSAPHLLVAVAPSSNSMSVVDCSIALSYIDLIAPIFGLGSCWAGYLMAAMQHYPPLRQALGISSAKSAHGALMLGFAQGAYRRTPARKQPKIKWH